MPESFIRYSDYFAHAVYMHETAHTPLNGLSQDILLVDEETAEAAITDVNTEDLAKELVNRVEAVRTQIISNFSQIHYVESSFVELGQYVRKKFNVTRVDDFLTENGIKVFNSYAKTSGALADPISKSNIKEN